MNGPNHGEVVATLGDGLSVASRCEDDRLTVVVDVKTGTDCVLHWGLSRRPGGAWQRPPDGCWPEGSTPADAHAVRTPLAAADKGRRQVAIRLDLPTIYNSLPFVLYFPQEKRWLKCGGKDFCIALPRGRGMATPEQALEAWAPGA